MTLQQANTQLQAAHSPHQITRSDDRRQPWAIQLGESRGALIFPTLADAVRFAVNTAPRRENA